MKRRKILTPEDRALIRSISRAVRRAENATRRASRAIESVMPDPDDEEAQGMRGKDARMLDAYGAAYRKMLRDMGDEFSRMTTPRLRRLHARLKGLNQTNCSWSTYALKAEFLSVAELELKKRRTMRGVRA